MSGDEAAGGGAGGGTRAAVVGGGVTGLAAAHRLRELSVEAVLLERAPRCGGVVLTERTDGFLVEAGPDSFLARKPWAAELCRRLGLGGELLPTDPANRGSFIWFGGRLHPLPEGLTSLVPTRLGPLARSQLLSPAGKARLLLEPLLPRGGPAGGADESLAGFFRRRLGQEASRRLVEPLVRGIYGGDPESLSLRATFPQLAEIERRHGSLIRGLLRESCAGARGAAGSAGAGSAGSAGSGADSGAAVEQGFLSLRRGMGSLVERLVEALPPDTVRTGSLVEGLAPAEGGAWDVGLGVAPPIRADAVILSTPPAETAKLLRSLDEGLAELVGGIRSGSSVTVALGFERSRVRHALRGYGFVVPEESGGPLLACTWASSKFPGRAPEGRVLLRAFMSDPDRLAGADDAAVVATAVEALRPIVGLEGEPALARVHRWREALPRYEVGHLERVERIEAALGRHRGLLLAGAAYHGVGIPDCVREGEAAAERASRHLAARTLKVRVSG